MAKKKTKAPSGRRISNRELAKLRKNVVAFGMWVEALAEGARYAEEGLRETLAILDAARGK